jgi:hypothetical protein
LYTDPDHGLVSIAETLNLKLLAPRKKITIMLIGKFAVACNFLKWNIRWKELALLDLPFYVLFV